MMSNSSMLYENDDIVEASITKSKPGQKVGLGLVEEEEDEEKRCGYNGGGKKKIVVARVDYGGLFQKYDLRAGDELLDVNGIHVTDREKFPNGLKDVKRFLRGEWSIRVRVGRRNNNNNNNNNRHSSSCSNSSRSSHTAATETSDISYLEEDEEHHHQQQQQQQQEQQQQQQQPENDASGQQRHDRGELGIAAKKEEQLLEAPGVVVAPPVPNRKAKRRGRRSAKKESLGALIRDVRSNTPSGHRRGKRRDTRDGQANETGDTTKTTTTKTTREAGSGHDRFTGNTNEPKEPIIEANSSGHNNRTTDNEKHEQELEAVENRNNYNNNNNNEKKIRGVTCSGSGVTLEMNDGNRVLVNPEELMAFFSEENGRLVAKSTKELDVVGKSSRVLDIAKSTRALDAAKSTRALDAAKSTRALDAAKSTRTLDVAKSTRALDSSSAPRPQLQRSQRERWLDISETNDDEETVEDIQNHVSPTLQHLRKLMKDNKKNTSSNQEESTKNAPAAIADLSNLLEKTKSIENLLKRNEWTRNSLASIILEGEQSSMTNNTMAPAAVTTGGSSSYSLCLRDLLGERLKKTNPKKWEESSMVSSTQACMTNLIDPGDLMKIRNLAARPKLNGATVEIVDRDAAVTGKKNRWNVRILQRKPHPRTTSRVSNNNNNNNKDDSHKKIISVAAENLKHFV